MWSGLVSNPNRSLIATLTLLLTKISWINNDNNNFSSKKITDTLFLIWLTYLLLLRESIKCYHPHHFLGREQLSAQLLFLCCPMYSVTWPIMQGAPSLEPLLLNYIGYMDPKRSPYPLFVLAPLTVADRARGYWIAATAVVRPRSIDLRMHSESLQIGSHELLGTNCNDGFQRWRWIKPVARWNGWQNRERERDVQQWFS